MFAPRRLSARLLVALMALAAAPAFCQQFNVPAGAPPEGRAAIEKAKREQAKKSGSKEDGKKDEKKSDEDKSDDDKKGDDKKDEEEKEGGPLKRPNEPPQPPDPRELEAKPDANGRVSFTFHGQPWVDVLQWLANVSSLSLDWRELPGDYLNLTTQRAYTLDEARDLINRHLQARGYALMLSGEVLSVVKLDKLDPSLAPRITEEELYDRQPHDIVKLSLGLPPGMEVKQAVEDVKQALSPTAKVMPLAATKRLLMIDTVANLRMVSALLNAERLAAEGRVVPREFVLEHVQATAVIDMLYVVLGMDPNTRPSQMELRMQQQKLELMSQMAQRGKDVMRLMEKGGPKVYLVYNRQRNSVLANAPPEQMEIISRTIEALDVPTGGVSEAPLAEASGRELQQYRLKTIAPNAVITTLQEIGNLSPRAELRGDTDSKTLFARGTDSDHQKITELIDQLDGAETVVEVFWLRRLPAEAVAGSIQSLIINQPKKKKEERNPFFFSFRRSRDEKPEEPETILRVDADIENNRLIVRGTPQQMDEVRDLLVKLGEPVEGAQDNRRVRVFDRLDPEQTARLLRQLETAWPAVGEETELVLPADAAKEAPDNNEADEETPKARTASRQSDSPFRLLAAKDDSPPTEEKDKPPVSLQVDGSGRIVIASDDTAALDRLEDLVSQLAPEPDRYKVFPVKNRSPDDVVASLRDYFADFLKPDDERVYTPWGEFSGTRPTKQGPVRLSQRRPLRFLSDDWSSTILVANATTSQLTEIDRLITAWDRQPIDDRIVTRRTTTLKLRYAKASTVVAALKEVYRDLLSRGDKEFDTQEQKASGSLTRYLTQIRYGEGGSSEPAFIGFDGLMSLGSDDDANVVIVSAQEEVFGSVLDAIRELDKQARPTTTVRVVQVEGGIAMAEVRRALLQALSGQNSSASSRRDRSDDGNRRRRSDRRRDRDRD